MTGRGFDETVIQLRNKKASETEVSIIVTGNRCCAGVITYPGVEGQHLRIVRIYHRRIWLENDNFSRRFQCRPTHGY